MGVPFDQIDFPVKRLMTFTPQEAKADYGPCAPLLHRPKSQPYPISKALSHTWVNLFYSSPRGITLANA